MPFTIRSTLTVPALGLALSLGACAAPETSSLDTAWSPFAAPAPVAADSLTAQRVRGANPDFTPLTPEPGNVWPTPEQPRPTLLGGPEEAFRNIPEYRPSLVTPVEPARSPVPVSGEGPRRGLPGQPPPPTPLTEPPRSPTAQPALPVTPPPPRLEGRALTDPSGRPAVSTGGTPRVEGFQQPGGGSGTVVRDGNVETWIGPDGQTRTRVVPR